MQYIPKLKSRLKFIYLLGDARGSDPQLNKEARDIPSIKSLFISRRTLKVLWDHNKFKLQLERPRVLPCWVITARMNMCYEVCAIACVCLCASIIFSTSWVTCECPVRNHFSVLLRTDKVIKSLFLSGMHRWIVHQFTTYFPMSFLFFPIFLLYSKLGLKREALV